MERVLKLIRQYNQLDLELYRYAQTLFEEQKAALPSKGSLNLKTFQGLNAVYGEVWPHIRPLLHKVRRLVKRR